MKEPFFRIFQKKSKNSEMAQNFATGRSTLSYYFTKINKTSLNNYKFEDIKMKP